MTDWLTEMFEQAERDWMALPVCARPVYVPAQESVLRAAADA